MSSVWLTAGVLDPSEAKLFAGRLAEHGIEHEITREGRCIKVSVLREHISAALSLRPDHDPKTVLRKPENSRWSYRASVRLLLSIPIGGLIGAQVQDRMTVETNLVSVSICLLFAFCCEVAWLRFTGD